jgi:hypothetical protein
MGTLFSPDTRPPRPRSRHLVAAFVGLGALAAAAGLWFFLHSTPPEPRRVTSVPHTPSRPLPTPAPLATPGPRGPERAAATPPPVAPPPLRVEADVPEASVFVDRHFLGKAPLDVRDIAPGSRRVQVAAEGYETQTHDVEIGDSPVLVSARFKEVRLDESLAVIHKHGIGSCRGRLHATVAAFAFEATDEKDSFSVPLPRLERFEVDYLKKNLRVSLSGGRTYNFTVDAENADPLLVFQRTVEAARKRL